MVTLIGNEHSDSISKSWTRLFAFNTLWKSMNPTCLLPAMAIYYRKLGSLTLIGQLVWQEKLLNSTKKKIDCHTLLLKVSKFEQKQQWLPPLEFFAHINSEVSTLSLDLQLSHTEIAYSRQITEVKHRWACSGLRLRASGCLQYLLFLGEGFVRSRWAISCDSRE